MRTLTLSLLALSTLLFTACGDDDGLDCSPFTACGGDVVGTWQIAGVCIEPDPDPIPDCEGESVSGSIQETGTVNLTSGGTYTANVTTSGSSSFTIPGMCLTGLTSCDQLTGGDPDTTCSGSVDSSCTCNTEQNETISETGTYTTSGNMITLTPDGETPDTAEYCVSGNTLRVNFDGSVIVLNK